MSAVLIDKLTGASNSDLQRDARLEIEIDAAWNRVKSKTSTDRESQDALTEVAVLMRRRSDTQWMKLEFQRRMDE
jgi:hypothetical protein